MYDMKDQDGCINNFRGVLRIPHTSQIHIEWILAAYAWCSPSVLVLTPATANYRWQKAMILNFFIDHLPLFFRPLP
jgi:hypothetical protein